MSADLQILLVGVGGQGVLTAARVIGAAAHAEGEPVVIGQLHGMSQRGGSVECTVLIGPRQSSFVLGDADVVMAFEPLELSRARERIGPQTRVVANIGTIAPYELTRDGRDYPDVDDIVTRVGAAAAQTIRLDGPQVVHDAGEHRTLNFAMLGALGALDALPFDSATLWTAACARMPAKFVESNRRAFELGSAQTRQQRGTDG